MRQLQTQQDQENRLPTTARANSFKILRTSGMAAARNTVHLKRVDKAEDSTTPPTPLRARDINRR
jgi:hypothetical protein